MTTTIDFPTIDFPDAVEDDAPLVSASVPSPLRHRVRHGVRHPENWLQLVRFAAVGASGYVVNLIVYVIGVHGIGLPYLVASTVAFLVSVINNFWLNRHWTFDAKHHHPAQQGVRFFVVSLLAYGFTEVVLVALVSGAGLDKVVAQAIAVASATPLSFLGQKLWSFRA
ncbi:MAG TPA: GtrA family protein [Solirubrobacteraceae bacterium]|jgi:dolichol-phosphate mannosyltransferase|nr:GtrA family protein [Solirubrobacteraceae bacterium]